MTRYLTTDLLRPALALSALLLGVAAKFLQRRVEP
jgi:hypothetical protein